MITIRNDKITPTKFPIKISNDSSENDFPQKFNQYLIRMVRKVMGRSGKKRGEAMITDYLLMSYIALASCWPVTLILLLVAVVVLLHAERRVLNVSVVVLVGFLVFAAWQFGATMRSPSLLLVQEALYILPG
ncbi:hypothetical protein ACMYSO_18110 [Klebsiella sp. B345]|uniref:hypothetical protein n=1 Tax=Klebsiella sp. B345 TaxID=2755398 RepID=UPI003DA9D161